MIDNYDSFTYNVVQYLYELKQDVKVYRNDEITIKEIEKLNPDFIVISPGPKTPKEAGITKDVIKNFSGKIPILGICLGHQAIAEVFGGTVVFAKELVHGKVSDVFHDGKTIFSGIESPFKATRYHSLAVSRNDIPSCLEISASTEDGEIMGIRHKKYRVEGVQFHPESILTQYGMKLLSNFIYGHKNGISVKTTINKVVSGSDLTEKEAERVMEMIMSGEVTPAQLAALLTGIRMKGETAAEITGFARVMRRKAEKVKVDDEIVVDTCGTGGDAKNTFNISTAAAFVLAGAGVKVAKHGNKAVSSKSGSADVLERLGVNITIPLDKVEQSIKQIGIGFMFAPLCHKAMKYAAGPRREMGIRTIFNMLGPLSNPAGAKFQVIGVYDKNLTEKLAEVLGRLGSEHVFVVSADDGLDEITLTGKTKVSEFFKGTVRTFEIDPLDYGFSYCRLDDLQVNNVNESADIIKRILNGEKGHFRNIVILNAASALVVSGKASDMKKAVLTAEEAIDSGKAYDKLRRLIEFSNLRV